MDASMVDFSDGWASWQISEYCNCTAIHAAAANPGPSLNTTSHTLPWLPTFPPPHTKRLNRCPGAPRAIMSTESLTRGASSPALGTSPNTVHTRPMPAAPHLFFTSSLHLSRSCISSGTLKQPPGIL
ncbi:hypothetical protein J3E68DRAFT_399826 [Trichoderma sp. SZMC 28012]